MSNRDQNRGPGHRGAAHASIEDLHVTEVDRDSHGRAVCKEGCTLCRSGGFAHRVEHGV